MSSSRNWDYDVFPSFRGADVRKTFLSHFLKELDLKSIKPFKDSEIERSHSIAPELIQAIRGSRIAVVVFSENYATSKWCLDELVEILKCKEELGQIVIPIFYDLDPFHVRKQLGKFGEAFKNTCLNKTKNEIQLWRQALNDVANLLGYHSHTCNNEPKMIEDIVSDIFHKLNETPSKDFDNFVGINNHIAEMNLLLCLEYEEARMVGIWGPSGIGKTTIARALFNLLARHFQGKAFIDRAFVSKSIEGYRRAKTGDHNMKLSLQGSFLSEILGKNIKIEHLGALRERLKHRKVLIIIDDLDDLVVLEALAGQTQWFGSGSRIIVVTKDKHLLEAHGIDHIYKVGFPSEKQALEMFCRSAFSQNSPPDGFMELASEVAAFSGGLPLGLVILGKVVKGRNKEDWIDMLPRLRKSPNRDIVETLRFSYDELDSEEDKAILRHIACLFNGVDVNNIKMMLSDSELDVNIGLKNLADKSLINVVPSWNNTNIVEMHCLVQEMGRDVVRKQSDKPGKREFLMNSKDICDVLRGCTGTEKVLGISLDIDEVKKVRIHKNAFDGMTNLRFLKFYKSSLERKKGFRWDLPERFNDFPDKLKLLSWPGYPMRCMPSNFCPEYLVELRMPNSKVEKLWEGVELLTCLKHMDFSESENLREIPDLSTATNLDTLVLNGCSSLVELHDISRNISKLNLSQTSIVKFPSKLHLEKLVELYMGQTKNERFWEGVQPLPSLKKIVFSGCANLKELPDLSMATRLETLNLSDCSSLAEVTLSTIQNLNKLMILDMTRCSSLETLPEGINLPSLYRLNLNGCSRLRSFPNISNNIAVLNLNQTGVEEVPQWIENFFSLELLEMWECNQLKCISPSIFTLDNLNKVAFSDCEQLTEVIWPEEVEDTNNARTNLALITFTNCFNSNQEAFIQQSASQILVLPGVEVPPYFTYRSNGSSLTIPLHRSSLSQQSFLEFKACVVVSEETVNHQLCFIDIQVHCRFRDKHGNYFEPPEPRFLSLHQKYNHLIIFHCQFPLNQDCDQVDIEFRLTSIRLLLKGCGIRLPDDPIPSLASLNEADESKAGDEELKGKEQVSLFNDCSSVENRLGNPKHLQHVCEANEENLANETENGEESGESNVKTESSRKRMRIT
ncbi:disease resistance protein RPS6 isoform X1 [Arabidopsis lyrata subsp. lyrata]|uniref:disease resistance protein RPS6 isoform X1 n=1 Tax=Arabidopsis lyrata subsp. lyrata TaxID=81972 RepID=UPI000A29C34A|nr:disease resistance protein RPS6 isoform X1 [Arabidopsis lyrata subsp. lyrata]|eukprot:XP_020867167.1 disease resistance protein RPS6 isoform X1 [Arabidopsis lyrata subsp. lyrata]